MLSVHVAFDGDGGDDVGADVVYFRLEYAVGHQLGCRLLKQGPSH